jgi:hypothetical protein
MLRFVYRGSLMLVLGALGLVLTRPVYADGLPKGEEILDKYVAATGGKEAYEKIKNRVITGTIEIPAQGLNGTVTTYAARPSKMYTILELGGIGKVEQGSDGKVAWEKSNLTGPRLKTGDEKAKALRDATFDGEAQWRKLYKKAECVAEEKVNGKPCYKVELTTQEGTTRTGYYDKQTNLAVKFIATEKGPMGEIAIEAYPSDYKKVDGILLPHKLQNKLAGIDVVLVFEKVEQNVKIPDNRFDLPEDVKKLAEK